MYIYGSQRRLRQNGEKLEKIGKQANEDKIGEQIVICKNYVRRQIESETP